MNKTVFNFSYETNLVEEVVVEPVKVLPDSLLESFDSKIACFTNKVPLDELSSTTLKSHSQKRFKQADLTDDEKKKDILLDKGNKSGGRAFFAPDKVTEEFSDPKTYTLHHQNIGGGAKHGQKTSFKKDARSIQSLVKNRADSSDMSNGEERTKLTHITDAFGKTVWKESVDVVSELAMQSFSSDKIKKSVTDNASLVASSKSGEACY